MPLYDKLQSVVLAAGKSTRFNSAGTKLIEKICGRPMIVYISKLLQELNIDSTFVVGHQKELIEDTIKKSITKNSKSELLQSKPLTHKINFVHQKEQLGTGHAVACTQDLWEKENILIVNGDGPLISAEIIETLYKKHIDSNAAISFVVATCPVANHAYGRVIKDKSGVNYSRIKIVEAKDFDKNIYTDNYDINAGIYIAKTDFLKNCIGKIGTQNAKKEFYLTDLVQIASDKNLNVVTHLAPYDRVMGINTPQELWQTEQIKQLDIIKNFINSGVRFSPNIISYTDPINSSINGSTHSSVYWLQIDADVEIGAGTTVEFGVQIFAGSKIGKNCNIRKFSTITNSIIEDEVEILQNSIIRDSQICTNAKIGPFAHVHSQSKIEQEAVIGNFVEIKASTIGQNSLALHLAYLGNTVTESMVNIGAGTITCNYDGIAKHSTLIKSNAFIGSNNTLVAPVTIGQNSFTAAGSTITEDVPADSLAIGRSKQVNKEDYVQKLLEKLRLRSFETNLNKNTGANKNTGNQNNRSDLEQDNFATTNTCACACKTDSNNKQNSI